MNLPATFIRDSKGKFSSNLDEAVWESTLDGLNEEECGDTDIAGHHVLVIFDAEERTALAALGDEDNDPVFTSAPYAAIVTTMCSGAVDVNYFDTEEEARKRWAKLDRRATEAAGPQDEDITTADHKTFFLNGKVFLRIEDDRPYGPILKAQMELEGFFPNVWFVSDHGNAHLLNLEAK